MFDFKVYSNESRAHIALIGSLSVREAKNLKDEIKKLLDSEITDLVFDFKELTYLDSSGIGILLHAHNWTRGTKKTITIQNVSPEVRTIFAVANLIKTFHIT